MKKLLYVLLVFSLILLFSCEEESSASAAEVASIAPGDLADFIPNSVPFSTDGQNELMAAAGAGYSMSGVAEDWAYSQEDVSAYLPPPTAPGLPLLGMTRAITGPTDSDYNDLMAAFNNGGDFSISASIVDEAVDFSVYGGAGILTLNASVSASGSISDPTASSGTDTISGNGEFKITGTGIKASITEYMETTTIDMPAISMNLVSNINAVHTYSSSSDNVAVNSNSAVVLAFSLSEILVNDTSVVPSGKYIYTLTLNEQVAVDTYSAQPDVGNVSATISLKIYDNDDVLIKSYTYTSDDLETAYMNM